MLLVTTDKRWDIVGVVSCCFASSTRLAIQRQFFQPQPVRLGHSTRPRKLFRRLILYSLSIVDSVATDESYRWLLIQASIHEAYFFRCVLCVYALVFLSMPRDLYALRITLANTYALVCLFLPLSEYRVFLWGRVYPLSSSVATFCWPCSLSVAVRFRKFSYLLRMSNFDFPCSVAETSWSVAFIVLIEEEKWCISSESNLSLSRHLWGFIVGSEVPVHSPSHL